MAKKLKKAQYGGGSSKGFSISRNVTKSPVDEYGNQEKTKNVTITKNGEPVRTKSTYNYKRVGPGANSNSLRDRVGYAGDALNQVFSPRSAGNYTKETMVKKGNMTKTTKVNAPNTTPTGSPKKTVTREYKKQGGSIKKKK
jgi:hypothetical protein